MPVQEFALDHVGNHRIQVHTGAESEPVTILLNSSILGSLTTAEERAAGKDFPLPDGSSVHVRIFNNQPQAFRYGYPLAIVQGVSPAVAEFIPEKKRGGCLTAWIIFNLVGASIATIVLLLVTLSVALNSNSTRPAWEFLVLALIGVAGIVGLSALLAWKKWGFYLVAFQIVSGIALAFPFGLVNASTFAPLIGLGILYYWLNKSKEWSQLSVWDQLT